MGGSHGEISGVLFGAGDRYERGAPAAHAQFWPQYGAMNGFGGFPSYGFGGYPYGGFGLGGSGLYGGAGLGYGFGPIRFGQGLYQQQAALTQQIYMQQQAGLLGQVRERQDTVARLDATRQQMFEQYRNLSDSDQATVRAGLMSDYLSLDAHGRAAWQRDAVVQIILGKDLARLDAAAQVDQLDPADQSRLRTALVDKYRSLAAAERLAWQKDPVVLRILGKDWWQK